MTRTTLSRQPGPESGWRMPEGYGCNFWSLYLWVLHPKQSQRSCQRSYTCAAHEWGKRGNAGKGCRAKSQSHLKSVAELHWLRLALSPDFICSEGFLCNCYSVLMSNNCYRKGKVRRRQHKSRGICPDPAWTRHFTAGFHCAHGWRGASSLCQCHIKVQCVVQDFSIPGLQTGTAWAACEMSWEMGLQQDKGPRSLWRWLGKCKTWSVIQRDSGNSCCKDCDSVTATRGFYIPVLPQEGWHHSPQWCDRSPADTGRGQMLSGGQGWLSWVRLSSLSIVLQLHHPAGFLHWGLCPSLAVLGHRHKFHGLGGSTGQEQLFPPFQSPSHMWRSWQAPIFYECLRLHNF